jgi:hypothetical protein
MTIPLRTARTWSGDGHAKVELAVVPANGPCAPINSWAVLCNKPTPKPLSSPGCQGLASLGRDVL